MSKRVQESSDAVSFRFHFRNGKKGGVIKQLEAIPETIEVRIPHKFVAEVVGEMEEDAKAETIKQLQRYRDRFVGEVDSTGV